MLDMSGELIKTFYASVIDTVYFCTIRDRPKGKQKKKKRRPQHAALAKENMKYEKNNEVRLNTSMHVRKSLLNKLCD